MSEQESKGLRQYLNKSNIHKVEPPILAIDYGTKNIGIAISDYKGLIAQPITIIKVKGRKFDAVLHEIKTIIDTYRVKSLVLGIPQSFKEAHLQNTDSILKFQGSVEKFTGMEVFLYDESYSTSDSYSILKTQGENQKKSRKKIDKIAATYFLQELIDFKNRYNE